MDVLTNYETSSDEEKDSKREKENPSSTSTARSSTAEHGVAVGEDGDGVKTRLESPPASPSSTKGSSHGSMSYRKETTSPRNSPTRRSSSPRKSDREDRREHTRGRSRSPPRRRSNSRSPGRSSGRDSGKRNEYGRDSRPARRHSSKEESERTHSRSPDRRGSHERPRHREHRRSPVRDGRDRQGYRRDREHNRDRGRDRRDRDRDRHRHDRDRDRPNRRWSRDGNYERGQDGRRSSDAERDMKASKSPEAPAAAKPPPVKPVVHLQGNKPLSSEEIQAKLAAHAELMRAQAQQAAVAVNMPTYLNPTVVNPLQYAQQMQKRKMLWSGKKKETPTAVWNETSFSNDSSGEVQAKFRRLMGIKEGAGHSAALPDTSKPANQSQKLMEDLENEFERSRAFQLSRGAGGKSGIGLGYTGT